MGFYEDLLDDSDDLEADEDNIDNSSNTNVSKSSSSGSNRNSPGWTRSVLTSKMSLGQEPSASASQDPGSIAAPTFTSVTTSTTAADVRVARKSLDTDTYPQYPVSPIFDKTNTVLNKTSPESNAQYYLSSPAENNAQCGQSVRSQCGQSQQSVQSVRSQCGQSQRSVQSVRPSSAGYNDKMSRLSRLLGDESAAAGGEHLPCTNHALTMY